MKRFVLLFQSRDTKGIVARVSDCILRQGGNIVTAHQHSTDPVGGDFFMRVEFLIDADVAREQVAAVFAGIAQEFGAQVSVFDKADVLRMGIFVSKPGHCLVDLLYLWRAGELNVSIPFVASNFEGHREIVEQFRVPFFYVPATRNDTREEELLAAAKGSDFLLLARYMQLLSPAFLKAYGKDIINIHHGFLPSFKGPHPYQQALDNGVKVIGATAHFATVALDEGPIIAQSVERVTHEDDLSSLIRKGRDLEKHALAEAVFKYVDYRIIRCGATTIVF